MTLIFLIEIGPLFGGRPLRILQRHEPVGIQALLPKAAIKGYDVAVIGRSAGS